MSKGGWGGEINGVTGDGTSPMFFCYFSFRDKGEGNNKVVVEMKTEKPNEQDGLLKNPTKEQVRPLGLLRGQGSLMQIRFEW